jgi:hypothetical protein
LAPQPGVVQFPYRGNLSVTSFCRISGVRLIVGDHDATLQRGVVASGAGVRGVKEPPEHHWVGYIGEIPLRIPVRSCGWQLTGGALGRLVAGGGAGTPGGRDMAARANPASCRVSVGGGNVRRRSTTQTDGEVRS